ncbi:MAG TPA: hypothetical protein VHJ20_22640 [Polyangia bacterium]|nr:hypothetical protein [Polyangia bacterium]
MSADADAREDVDAPVDAPASVDARDDTDAPLDAGTDAGSPNCRATWPDGLQVGTAKDDQVLGMTADRDGNLFVAGYEFGTVGVTNIEPDGDSQAVVVKLGPDSALLWKTKIDTPATETAEDVAIDPATGDLMVVGRTSGALPGFTNQGQFDLFLARLKAGGSLSTVTQLGNERPQHPARLALGPSGTGVVAGWDDTYVPTNYVAANQVGFTMDFTMGAGSAPELVPGDLDYLFTPSQLPPFSFYTGVAVDGEGARYLTSLVASDRNGPNGIFVTKQRADHSIAWQGRISPAAFDAVNAVVLSPSGDLFVTGGTFNKLGAKVFGQEDAYVLKIAATTGALAWATQMGGPDSDYPTAIAIDAHGDVVISGITLGSVVDGVTNRGEGDVFAAKLSGADGTLLSTWQTGTTADDEATSLAIDACGDVLVGGATSGTIVPGATSAGGEDMFILRAKL